MGDLLVPLTRAANRPLGFTSGDYVSQVGSGIFPTAAISNCSVGSANKIYLTPRYVAGVERYDLVSIEATTGGSSSVCHVGVFANTVSGRPGALLLDSGEIDISSTAEAHATIALTLANCWVWDGIVFNNTAATMRGLTSSYASRIPLLTNNVTSLQGSLQASHAYASLPATCPATVQGDSRWFRIQWRIA